MRSAMILAAGLGTRLRPLTDERPKPAVPVGDRPLIAQIARQLSGWSERIVVNTHHLPHAISSALADFASNVDVAHEPQILGTAGGVAAARGRLGAPCVVWNGDILIDSPPLEAASQAAGDGTCLLVAPREDSGGTVGIAADGAVVRLRNQRVGEEVSSADYVGVALLGQSALSALPKKGCLIGDFCLPSLARGERVATYPIDGRWRDVGSLSGYLLANLSWLRSNSSGHGSWVAPDARVDPGVDLGACVVGAGARVRGFGRLERCVVWPGAVAVAPLSDAVVTPRHVVECSLGPDSE